MAFSSKHTPAPPARLSLAVSLKCMVRPYEGNISPTVLLLFITSKTLGKKRTGVATGTNERNNGASPEGEFHAPNSPPTSTCSQLKVIASPLGSVALPANLNGVDFGML